MEVLRGGVGKEGPGLCGEIGLRSEVVVYHYRTMEEHLRIPLLRNLLLLGDLLLTMLLLRSPSLYAMVAVMAMTLGSNTIVPDIFSVD